MLPSATDSGRWMLELLRDGDDWVSRLELRDEAAGLDPLSCLRAEISAPINPDLQVSQTRKATHIT